MTQQHTAEALAKEMWAYGQTTMNRWALDGAVLIRSQAAEIERLKAEQAKVEMQDVKLEPVAWTVAGDVKHWGMDFSKYQTQHYVRPVFAAPVQPVREVLTDEQIDRCIEAADARWADSFVPVQWARHLAKAIEAAHGITKD